MAFEGNGAISETKVAVITTRRVDEKNQYIKQTGAYTIMVTAAKTNDLQMRPLMYRLLPEPPLRTEQFLTDNDNLDDEEVVKKKIKDLFGGLIPEKLIVFVHGYNTKAEGALQAAQTLSEATGLHVLAFDWASEHDLGFLPVKYKSLHSGLVTGYMKDTEEAVASVEALNWLLFIILRGIKQDFTIPPKLHR
mmetsp:Transcript_10920/g.32725  ORF Transcript_10920/g.32725 Transcript_10920/m.32725 type:complete len:192 (+) Transcript_10920:324-899(+)